MNGLERVQRTKEAIEELAREQARSQAEKRVREKLGIPDTSVLIISRLPEVTPIFEDRESRIKISPYAKFDKYHRKKRRF